MSLAAFSSGFSLGLSLILAIGAQNAFVLRQGLRQEHVFWVCLVCAMCDVILICLGVFGFGWVQNFIPDIALFMRWFGAAFLILYGLRSLWSALRSKEYLAPSQAIRAPLSTVLAKCLALTFLNPHVYLDTVVLLGSVSLTFSMARSSFAIGAVSASFTFFFALGYLARFLAPLLAKPGAWRWLDGLIAIIMLALAVALILGV